MADSLTLDSLIVVAKELYGLDPREFTAARAARVKELKQSDATLAKQVGVLKKPSPAAWVVNLLARDQTKKVSALLELGATMRSAQDALDRAELSRLSKQRRDDVRALVAEGANLASESDVRPSAAVLAEVEQSLLAGTVDTDAAAAVLSGRLVRAISATGFEEVDLEDAVAAPEAGSRAAQGSNPRPPVDIAVARRRAEARKEAARLEREAAAAASDLEQVDRRSRKLDERKDSLNEEISVLEERLQATEIQLTTLEGEMREVAAERTRVQKAAEDADRLAEEARASLE